MMPVDVRPLCADRLDLVDATFGKGKAANAASRELAVLCRRCPVAEACFFEGASRRQYGTWAGTRRVSKPGAPVGGRLKVVA